MTQNVTLPRFHIHNHYTKDGSIFYFRHWILESGNLSSSLTVLSPLVFVAVYDEVKQESEVHTSEGQEGQGSTIDKNTQESVSPISDECPYLGEYTDVNAHTHDHYCKLCGLNPRNYKDYFEELGDCPYVKALRQLYDPVLETNPTPKSKPNDLKQTTMIEIEDISNLLKALFKVNIDIAHREYFLKIDVPDASNWWYGYTTGDVKPYIVCDSGSQQICYTSSSDNDVVCLDDGNWISFEPTVELKFSNFHSDNQLDEEGNLVCTTKSRDDIPLIVPVNRELSFTSEKNECVQYNDIFYCYDYWKAWKGTHKRVDDEDIDNTEVKKISIPIGDNQNFYEVKPLCLYQNTQLQSPLDVNDFIRHRLSEIERGTKQLRTFTSIVKKYRPVVMPEVRDIFNDCHAASATKYDADVDNNYGVFGWCTIPSKTMVNMEYNEGALYVPSSFDHHNRIGGSNFLQMDNDFKKVYQVWIQKNGYDPDEERVGHLDDNAKNTWAWLYNSRDWTYFAKPFFDVGRNNDVYSNQLDTYGYSEIGYPGTKNSLCPENSNHLNGVVFEKSAEGRSEDLTFLGIASSCRFLATRHHNENNLKVLSERYTGLLSYSQLKELTNKSDFNDVYGSQYTLPNGLSWSDVRLPFLDWVDDYDKTGSYVELTLGKYDPKSSST